jgi:CheY-like chemotaxis protein
LESQYFGDPGLGYQVSESGVMNPIKTFGDTAVNLARSPLGIIALLIVLIYAFASLVVGVSGELTHGERLPLVWFLVVFPVLVLLVFGWLVAYFHDHLYSPGELTPEGFIRLSEAERERERLLGAASVKAEALRISTDPKFATEPTEATSTALNEVLVRAGSTLAQNDGRRDASSAAETATSRANDLRTTSILWVDDRPEQNALERQALATLGVKFSLARSTRDAEEILRSGQFDAIISDLGRPEGRRAGFELLDSLRASGRRTPFFIYTNSTDRENLDQARKLGADGLTSNPDELVALIRKRLGI